MASKSKKRRKVLGASCILAALIVAGSSFAWFTSKDEVVNRLTATANYGVSIAEDFTPPENWLPGQEVNKDVGIVNTGNVAAFVRTWLEGEMKVIARSAEGGALNVDGAGTWDPSATDKLSVAQMVQLGSTGNYVRVLNKSRANAPSTYSEVQSMQAGGWLAYAPSGCEWQYTETKASTDPAVISGDTTVTAGTGTTSATNTYVAAGTYGCAVDAESFRPKTTGLYLFRRNADANTLDTDSNVYYSGYYYVAGSGYGDGTYYTLNTETNGVGKSVYAAHVGDDGKIYTHSDTSGEALAAGSSTDMLLAEDVANVKLFQAQQRVVNNGDLTWTYDAANGKFSVSPTTGIGEGVDVTVQLVKNNLGTAADNWAAIQTATDPKKTTFYYTNDLEGGATTSQLVDSVKLDDTVSADDYVTFDFDLNVKMDSIQVTSDSAGKETYESVATAWAVASGDSATGAHVSAATYENDNKELKLLTWEIDS